MNVSTRSRLAVVVAALALCLMMVTVDAPAADQIIKRISTSHAEVVAHIRATPAFRGSQDDPASSIKVGVCRGYHFNRAHKAKTWRCSYTYSITRQCHGNYHGGYVRFRMADGRNGTRWQDDEPSKTCDRP